MNKLIVILVLTGLNFCCGIYSFNDASIPPEVKTIKINVFKNNALLVNPIINTMAANELISKIRNQTRLFIVNNSNADYEISGTINGYTVSTTNINNNQVVKNQLTLDITYSFINHIESQIPNIKSADFPLSINQEFEATQTLSAVENDLLSTMIPQITTQAFNKIFSSW